MTAEGHGGLADGGLKLAATRLWLSSKLDVDDRGALARACGDMRTVRAGGELTRQAAPADALHILLDGWAARSKIMEDGSRYLSALLVPGDLCDVDALLFDRLNYGITALTACTVITLPRQRALALVGAHPGIAAAFAWLTFIENAILTEWAAAMGRRSAQERLARLLCELLMRLKAVGKAEEDSYELPLTQEHLADALGLTSVHVNRTLQTLRASDLVTVQGRRVTIHDWAGLCALGGFRAGYLHLEGVDEEARGHVFASRARNGARTMVAGPAQIGA